MIRALLLLAALAALASAHAQPARFEGAWNVTLVCPPHDDDDDAKGYTHRFTGQIVDGEFSATHGKQGEPGWHFLHGRVNAKGNATLHLDGIVNNPKYAINGAARGKPYSYRVKAHFDDTSGVGQRLTGRVCEFTFVR